MPLQPMSLDVEVTRWPPRSVVIAGVSVVVAYRHRPSRPVRQWLEKPACTAATGSAALIGLPVDRPASPQGHGQLADRRPRYLSQLVGGQRIASSLRHRQQHRLFVARRLTAATETGAASPPIFRRTPVESCFAVAPDGPRGADLFQPSSRMSAATTCVPRKGAEAVVQPL